VRAPRAIAPALLALAAAAGCSDPPPAPPPPPPLPHYEPAEHVEQATRFGLPEGLAVGQWSEVTARTAGRTTVRRVSVVGRTERGWRIEIDDSAEGGLVRGLLVGAGGDVLEGWIGAPGVPPRKLALIPSGPVAAVGAKPDEAEEWVTVGAGTFRCRRTTVETPQGRATTWVGLDDPVKDLLVKTAGSAGRYGLYALEQKALELGGESFPCRVATYGNGQTVWRSAAPVLFAGHVLRASGPRSSVELTGRGADAKPRLVWP